MCTLRLFETKALGVYPSHFLVLHLFVSIHIPNELRCENDMLPDVLIWLTKNKN